MGVKVTAIEQFAPGATEVAQVLVWKVAGINTLDANTADTEGHLL